MAIPILGDVDFNYGELKQAVLWMQHAVDVLNLTVDKRGLIFRDGGDTLPWYSGLGDDQLVGICRGVMRAEVFRLIQTSINGEYVIEHDFGEIYTTNPRIFWDIESIYSDYPDGGAHTVVRHNIFTRYSFYLDNDLNYSFKIRIQLLHRLYDESGNLYSEQLLDERIEWNYASGNSENAAYFDYGGYSGVLHGDIMTDIPPRYRSVVYVKIQGVPATTPATTLNLKLMGYYEVQEVNTWLSP